MGGPGSGRKPSGRQNPLKQQSKQSLKKIRTWKNKLFPKLATKLGKNKSW